MKIEFKESTKEFLVYKYIMCKEKFKAIGSDLRLLKKNTIYDELCILVPTKEQIKKVC